LLAAALLPWIAACSRHGTDPQIFSAPILSAAAAEAGYVDAGKSNGYAFRIAYPPLTAQWSALDKAMRDFGAKLKRDTLGAAADWKPGQPEYTLDLSFDVARRTRGFVSVLTDGDAYTGGAHGMPITASFNLDLASGKLVSLGELFDDPAAARKVLSDECRRQLEGRYEAKIRDNSSTMSSAQQASDIRHMRQWIEKGTAPTPDNFRVFLVDGLDAPAIGLTLIFPPYQVASFADGVQQVEVPAELFYQLLKPEYRDAFAVDTQRTQAGTR
jgi:hypothetical protein